MSVDGRGISDKKDNIYNVKLCIVFLSQVTTFYVSALQRKTLLKTSVFEQFLLKRPFIKDVIDRGVGLLDKLIQ